MRQPTTDIVISACTAVKLKAVLTGLIDALGDQSVHIQSGRSGASDTIQIQGYEEDKTLLIRPRGGAGLQKEDRVVNGCRGTR